jgi:hypothetical protein
MLEFIKNFYFTLRNLIPEEYSVILDLAIYTVVIALYSIFIWKFYKFLARREIIELNLRQYNHSQYSSLEKLIAVLLYTLEYLIILPFLVLFWFVTFSAFLLLLSEQGNVDQMLLISAAIIASTRITAYISEDLSKDLAKIFPFTVLATYLLNPNFFDIPSLVDKVIALPSAIVPMIMFVIFIFIVEFVLRGSYSISQLARSNSPKKIKEGEESDDSSDD